MAKSGNKRTYATIIYPEHFENKQQIVDIIASKHVEAYLSPLHDKDVQSDGTLKKAHYHLLVSFDGTRSKEYASQFFDELGGVGLEAIESKRGMARYLVHADNIEKYQYDKSEVVSFCGVYEQFFDSLDDKRNLFFQILDFIDENNIIYYNHLLKYCRTSRRDWFDMLTGHKSQSIFMYLKSKKFESDTEKLEMYKQCYAPTHYDTLTRATGDGRAYVRGEAQKLDFT